MKRIFLGPLGPASYRSTWVDNGLKMIERWINTLVEFKGAAADRDGSDGLVPQPMAGDENKALFGDGKWRAPGGGASGTLPGTIPIYDAGGNPVTDPDFRYDPTTDTLYAPHITAQSVDADVMFVDPEVYGPGWNGDNSVPTKNDIYDQLESMAVGGGSSVPVFYTQIPIPVTATIGIHEYPVIAGAITVDIAVTKVVWINAVIIGSGKVKKKRRGRAQIWSFDIQLKSGSNYLSFGTAQVAIPANGKWTPFTLAIIGALTRVPDGPYSVVLISNLAGSISPGPLTVNVMGQGPK